MTSGRSTNWIYQGVYYLAAVLLYAAILMRSFLLYRDTPVFAKVLGLLLLFMGLFLVELALARHGKIWFLTYLLLQTILTSMLIYGAEFNEYDYFSLLFAILGMQVMRKLNINASLLWMLTFFILIGYRFFKMEGPTEGLTRLLLFGSSIVFPVSFSLAAHRTQEAHTNNQSLTQQLQVANQQMQAYSDTMEQLGVVRERQRLARELHDSVTQTIFSMNLTTQSALLLIEREPSRVGTQLERLNQLAQSAMTEMHTLISELRPEQVAVGGLVTALRQHINSRQLPDGLSVTIEVDGEQTLLPLEDQGLFRIAQEALNNIVKHAHATRVSLRLHMEEPFWIEINDDGMGFDLQQPLGGGKVGLAGMGERAEEIDWILTIQTAPGEGARIRVEKKYPGEVSV